MRYLRYKGWFELHGHVLKFFRKDREGAATHVQACMRMASRRRAYNLAMREHRHAQRIEAFRRNRAARLLQVGGKLLIASGCFWLLLIASDRF